MPNDKHTACGMCNLWRLCSECLVSSVTAKRLKSYERTCEEMKGEIQVAVEAAGYGSQPTAEASDVGPNVDNMPKKRKLNSTAKD